MMSIGAALATATTLVGGTLPAGLMAKRSSAPAHTAEETEDSPEAPPADAALLVAVEAGLREAGYLPA